MPFTAEELSNIANAHLEHFIERGKVFAQNVQNKPMLRAFDEARGSFPGGKDYVSLAVKSGQGGNSLAGYTHDDVTSFVNTTGIKRVKYGWKEHHIGTVITHTELKIDGIDVNESGTETSEMDGREAHTLAGLLDDKRDVLGEDYAKSLDSLIHGDGTSDTKALAGIRSLLLEAPATGTTGGLSRSANSWWRNRALTTANSAVITSNVANGGALIQALQKDYRQLMRYATGATKHRWFAGSDFIDAYERELRANGRYSETGFMGGNGTDGGMSDVKFKGKLFEYDPTLDDISKSKFCYAIDMSAIKLLYMNGQRMKKHTPQRPYDRYVMFNALTTTAVMTARQLNTSAIYEIA